MSRRENPAPGESPFALPSCYHGKRVRTRRNTCGETGISCKRCPHALANGKSQVAFIFVIHMTHMGKSQVLFLFAIHMAHTGENPYINNPRYSRYPVGLDEIPSSVDKTSRGEGTACPPKYSGNAYQCLAGTGQEGEKQRRERNGRGPPPPRPS